VCLSTKMRTTASNDLGTCMCLIFDRIACCEMICGFRMIDHSDTTNHTIRKCLERTRSGLTLWGHKQSSGKQTERTQEFWRELWIWVNCKQTTRAQRFVRNFEAWSKSGEHARSGTTGSAFPITTYCGKVAKTVSTMLRFLLC
jgi:hypothetical protein